jgi:hypothetical protein
LNLLAFHVPVVEVGEVPVVDQDQKADLGFGGFDGVAEMLEAAPAVLERVEWPVELAVLMVGAVVGGSGDAGLHDWSAQAVWVGMKVAVVAAAGWLGVVVGEFEAGGRNSATGRAGLVESRYVAAVVVES